jgi:hypothetical protein
LLTVAASVEVAASAGVSRQQRRLTRHRSPPLPQPPPSTGSALEGHANHRGEPIPAFNFILAGPLRPSSPRPRGVLAFPEFRRCRCRPRLHRYPVTTIREKTFSVGKYLVSPLTRRTESGEYAASLSIRSGNGISAHDRVYRFIPQFATRAGARRYAIEQGMTWLGEPGIA